jgi:hypothetical protein
VVFVKRHIENISADLNLGANIENLTISLPDEIYVAREHGHHLLRSIDEMSS